MNRRGAAPGIRWSCQSRSQRHDLRGRRRCLNLFLGCTRRGAPLLLTTWAAPFIFARRSRRRCFILTIFNVDLFNLSLACFSPLGNRHCVRRHVAVFFLCRIMSLLVQHLHHGLLQLHRLVSLNQELSTVGQFRHIVAASTQSRSICQCWSGTVSHIRPPNSAR